MARIQLHELGDQAWVPLAFRHYLTDFLSFMIRTAARLPGSALEPVSRELASALQLTGDDRLLDLCSGSGGPAVVLRRALAESGTELSLTLSDLVPNTQALAAIAEREGEGVDFHAEPLDATSVPSDLPGFRVVFNAFHHLPPAAARGVLADAARAGRGIAVLEVTERSPVALLFMVTVLPLAVLLLTPFVRPWRPGRLLWTYLLPWMPPMLVFDGIVSCLRTYSPPELRELTATIEAPGYGWRIQRLPAGLPGLHVTLLVGAPGLEATHEHGVA